MKAWVAYWKSIALGTALGMSTVALLGCGTSELGTVHVPENLRTKAEPAPGRGIPGSRTAKARPQVGR